MIGEKKLIENLMEEIPLAENVHIFIDIINNQPKVGEWIPVSEGLPDEKIDPITSDYYTYPVTVKFKDIITVRYYKFGKGHWWHYGENMDKYVIAWMPVFEPWKGE